MTATRYLILDASGVHMAAHVREDLEDRDGTPKKRVWWERSDGKKGLGDLPTSDLPLYGVERPCDHERASVVVCEGEKDPAALSRIGVLAVGTVTGAGGTPSNEVLRWLLGRDVILWPPPRQPRSS